MRLTRRRALQGLSATLAGTATVTPLSPVACVDPPADFLTLAKSRIDTIVVVMMENRSFDHSFGALSLVEGRADIDGLQATMQNLRLDGTTAIAPSAADAGCIGDPPHGWDASHAQWNFGACDGFVTEYERRADGRDFPYRVMDYLPREMQPASFALGENFALCQRWFASVMGPTWPNRYHLLAGTSHGLQSNDFIGREVDHIYTRLIRGDVPFGNSYANLPFGIVLEGVSIDFPEMNKHDAFFERAAAGTLRSVEIIDPVYGRSDDHPPAHPVAGQIFLQSVYEALRTSPQWQRSLLVVTYDEHGGFFDHVSPPTVEDDYAELGFDQLGFRVPSFVVGPFVKQAISNEVFDHTSVFATIAALHDLEPLSLRGSKANTLLSLLDEEAMRADTPREGPALPAIVADEAEIFADECRGFSFHGGAKEQLGDITGQPELEALFHKRFPSAARGLRADTEGAMKDLLAHAESQGVWRRR